MQDIQNGKDVSHMSEKNGSRETLSKVLIYLFLSIWALICLGPMIWVFINSFKSSQEILVNALSLPSSFNIANFKSLGQYSQINIAHSFFNSLMISGPVVILVLIIGAMAAFVLGRFKFSWNGPVMILLVSSMLIPQFAVILPNIYIFQALHINGTYLAVITPHTAGFMNFAIILMAGFMKNLPVELEEAAIIDGCGIPRIFQSIILPLSTPIMATAAIMVFLWSYNDLLLPLIYLPIPLQPVSVLMTKVSSIYDTNYGAMMAAVTIILIPVVILYIAAQEWVISGLTAGAVKG